MTTTTEVYEPHNVLITGGCGFIGSNFVNYIFDAWPNAQFINVDKLILNSDVNNVHRDVINSSRYRLVTSDIRNRQLMIDLLNKHQIDTVIHFAADCTSVHCYNSPTHAIDINVVAFVEFLESIRCYANVQRFIHISTDEVYGDSAIADDEKPKLENDPLRPGNPYAATKVACEAFVHCYRTSYRLPSIIVRINNIYGPNQWNVKVIPRYIETAKRADPFTIQGSGKQLRSWLYVDDASDGIRAIVERGRLGEIYNLGTYFEMNVRDLAQVIQKEVDIQLNRESKPVEYVSIPDRPYNDQRYLIDISKVERELGWQPKTPFDEGLRRVIAHALTENRIEEQRMTVAIYGGNGWVGKQMQELFRAKNIPHQVAAMRIGTNSDAEVLAELNRIAPTHVVCCTGRTHGGNIKTIEYLEGGADKTHENLRDNLYSVLFLADACRRLGIHYVYVGTGYIYRYDDLHPVGGRAFADTDVPNFFGNSYSVVKGFTDRLIALCNTDALNARITLPINFELHEERNLLAKLLTYPKIFDIPVSLTIMPDCMPILVDLMKRRVGGALNLVNPTPISLHDIVELYREIVDSDAGEHERIGIDSEIGARLMATKAHCALDTRRLVELCPTVPNARQSLETAFRQLASIKKGTD